MNQYTKQYTGLLFGILLLVCIAFFIPCPEGMTVEGQKVLGITAFALCVWCLGSFPIGIGSVAAMSLLPILGLMTIDETLQQFMRPATFFVVATFALSCALSKTPLASRVLRAMLKIAGTSTNKIILALMVCTAILSTIMSNIPVTAMMMTVCFSILNAMEAKPGESKIGKVLMIGIPFAAMCGGIATPAGSSVNVIAIGILADTTGETITFLEWMIYGVPLAICFVLISWFLIIKFFKPEEIPVEVVMSLSDEEAIPEKITKKEWKAIAIIAITLILWILGSWIPLLDMTLVATISMILFFLPGINVFTWEDFASSISWDAIMTVGSVMAIASAVVKTGVGEWIVNMLFTDAGNWSVLLLFVVVAFATNFIHFVLPVAPSIVSMLLPSLLILAQNTGYSTIAFTIIVSMMAGCVMLLPIDTLTVLTYSTGYYKIKDLFKVGIVNSCIWAAVIAIWAYLISSILV